jgi:hypothetical protein
MSNSSRQIVRDRRRTDERQSSKFFTQTVITWRKRLDEIGVCPPELPDGGSDISKIDNRDLFIATRNPGPGPKKN